MSFQAIFRITKPHFKQNWVGLLFVPLSVTLNFAYYMDG